MRWARISVVTTHEGADLIANILMELGAAGTEIDDPSLVNEYIDAGLWDYTDLPRAEDTETVTVRAYLPEDARLESSLLALAERIAALRHAGAALGAGEVIAMDYDPVAVSVAEENIRQNNVHNVVACESDLLSACEGAAPAELITANIIADVIIRLFAQLDRHLAPGGTLLASGIIDDRIAGVEHAAAEHGFTVLDMTCEKEWAAMIIRRTSDLKN